MGTLFPLFLQLAALTSIQGSGSESPPVELVQRLGALENEARLLNRKLTMDNLVSIRLKTRGHQNAPPLSAGGQPLLVHLWSVHCPPCKKEMPEVAALFDRLHAVTPIRVVLVAEDSLESIDDYLIQVSNNIPAGELYVAGPASSLRAALQKAPLPTTLLMDGHMVVRQAFIGPLSRRRNDLFSAVARLCTSLNASCRNQQ